MKHKQIIYNGVDAFVPGIGTVRECIDCGALIAGGPTRCIRCVKEGPPRRRNKPLAWLRGVVSRLREMEGD